MMDAKVKMFGEYVTLYPPYRDTVDLQTIKPCKVTFANFMPSSLDEIKQFSENLSAAVKEATEINQKISKGLV